eukprot:scaffold2972_cov64-Phaeocystis_antarctica.AAC.14
MAARGRRPPTATFQATRVKNSLPTSAYMATRGEMSDFGGGWLEQLRGSCWDPSGRASPCECRAAQSQHARPGEAREAI